MIIRSALKGLISTSWGARFISSTSTPLLSIYDSTSERSNPQNLIDEQLELVETLHWEAGNHEKRARAMKQTKVGFEALNRSKDMERFHGRKWKDGDIYSPHDLSPEEMKKWRKPQQATEDAFDILGINPLHEYKVSQNL